MDKIINYKCSCINLIAVIFILILILQTTQAEEIETTTDSSNKSDVAINGEERKLDNNAFGGDITTRNGGYQFKIHRAFYDFTGFIVDVKKPDGTEVQEVAWENKNVIVGDVEIYTTNVVAGGDFVRADILINGKEAVRQLRVIKSF